MDQRILITGFEAFRSFEVNSSWEAAKGAALNDESLVSRVLPVDHLGAANELEDTLSTVRPSVLLLCGLAAGSTFRLETRARKPEQLFHLEGPEELVGIWPWDSAKETLLKNGYPIELSQDAGQYVCESTYWYALNHQSRSSYLKHVCFLHVPPLSDRFTADYIAKGIQLALWALKQDSNPD